MNPPVKSEKLSVGTGRSLDPSLSCGGVSFEGEKVTGCTQAREKSGPGRIGEAMASTSVSPKQGSNDYQQVEFDRPPVFVSPVS